MMKLGNLVNGLVLSAGLCAASESNAADKVPDMVGTWVCEARGESRAHTEGGALAAKTHIPKELGTVTLQLSFTSQEGRTLRGTVTSPRATEKMEAFIPRQAGDIHFPNRIIFNDEDGIGDGFIVGNRIFYIYRHVNESDMTVVSGVCTRKR